MTVAKRPERAYEHGNFLDGLGDAACVPAEILAVAWQILRTRTCQQTCMLTFIYLCVVYLLDPIGVATNSARSSEEFFYRIVAPDYPTVGIDADSGDSADDRNRIVVVMINDATLRELGETWPPALSIHAKVLEKILGESAPKAVFIDFGFYDLRNSEDVEELAGTLRSYALPTEDLQGASELWPRPFRSADAPALDGATPVFLAGAPEGLTVIDKLKNAVTGLVSTRYAAAREQKYNSYALYDYCQGTPSAALALYAAERDNWRRWSVTGCPVKRSSRGTPGDLSVYWATWGSEDDGRGIYPCSNLPDTRGGRLRQVFKIWLFDIVGRDDAWADQFQTCPPHLAIAAQDILNDTGGYASLLVDSFVIYGGNFALADDLIVPPTHRPLPGAFLHAMALDNLLRLDPYVGRAGGNWWLTLITAAAMSVMVALAWNGYGFVVGLIATGTVLPAVAGNGDPVWERPFSQAPHFSEAQIIGAAWWFACLTLSVAVVIFALWTGFFMLHWAPANFVGLLTFLGLHTAITSVRQLITSINAKLLS